MPEHFFADREGRQSPDRIDELGILYWKISVLVIGLRMVIAVPLYPRLLAMLIQVVTLLLWGALGLVIASLLGLLWRTTSWSYQRPEARPAAGLDAIWRAWLGRDWLIKLAIDCTLAAAIIPLAFMLAVQERLDWRGVIWLMFVGMIRVVFREQCRRAGSSQKALLRGP